MTKKTALRCRHRPQGPWLLKVQQQSPLAERRKVSRDQLALAEKQKNQKKEQGGVRNKLTHDAPGTPCPVCNQRDDPRDQPKMPPGSGFRRRWRPASIALTSAPRTATVLSPRRW